MSELKLISVGGTLKAAYVCDGDVFCHLTGIYEVVDTPVNRARLLKMAEMHGLRATFGGESATSTIREQRDARLERVKANLEDLMKRRREALIELADTMIADGLYAAKSGKKDVRASVFRYVAKANGWRYADAFLRSRKETRKDWY